MTMKERIVIFTILAVILSLLFTLSPYAMFCTSLLCLGLSLFSEEIF